MMDMRLNRGEMVVIIAIDAPTSDQDGALVVVFH
jgi:hypothetical protein